MANLSITISNSLRVFGLAPTSNWNSFSWGTGFWGEGSGHVLVDVGHQLMSEGFSVMDSFTTQTDFNLSISDSFSPTSDVTDVGLLDAAGYNHVFTRPTINSDDRNNTTYSEVSIPVTPWTSPSVPGTSWSEQ